MIKQLTHAEMDAHRLPYTIFSDTKALVKKELCTSLEVFYKNLESPPTFGSKAECPLLKMGTFGPVKTASGSLRHDANMLAVAGVEGDYDKELVTVDEAARLLARAGIEGVIYTTASNGVMAGSAKGGPRWRVFVPLSRLHTPAERRAITAKLNHALGGILAPESFTASQSYYFGRVEGVPYETRRVRGQFIDLIEGLGETYSAKGNDLNRNSGAPGNYAGPVSLNIFEDAVAREGRLLASGDGRRELLKTYIASRSAKRLPADELRLLVAGVATQFFDPDDPIDDDNINQIIEHFAAKDAFAELDFSSLIGDTVDSETGEILSAPQTQDEPQDVSLADLASFAPTPPAFWADEILPADCVTLLGAHGGTGKTTLALYAAVCFAMGLPFLGKETKAAKVLFYSAEDDAALLRWRLANVCQRLEVDPVALSQRLSVVDASEADSVLYVEASRGGVKLGEPTTAFKKLIARMAVHGSEIVILDNASDVYGADEINRVQVRTFIRLLARLVRPRHGAVLLLAHVDKLTARTGGTQGYSGSTAWHNSVRSRLFLTADEKTGELLLEHQKSNRGKRAESMRLVWDGGLPVLEQETAQGSTGTFDIKEMRLKTVLSTMAEFYKRGEFCSTSTTAHTNAFKVMSAEPGFPKIPKTELWLMLRDAERRGLIVREEYQSNHRNTCQRWRVSASSQGSAFSVSSPNENSEHAGGTRPASSPVGGMGGEDAARSTQTANALPDLITHETNFN